jgi:hypothetical protein
VALLPPVPGVPPVAVVPPVPGLPPVAVVPPVPGLPPVAVVPPVPGLPPVATPPPVPIDPPVPVVPPLAPLFPPSLEAPPVPPPASSVLSGDAQAAKERVNNRGRTRAGFMIPPIRKGDGRKGNGGSPAPRAPPLADLHKIVLTRKQFGRLEVPRLA